MTLLLLVLQVLFVLLLGMAFCWFVARPSRQMGATSMHTFGEWQAAKARAEGLLVEILSEEEYSQLNRCGYLEVRSRSTPARVYRVPRYRGRVHVYQDDEPIMSLCIQPTQLVPDADVVLIHKLMIEGDEEKYLRVANRFEVTGFGHYG